MATVPQRATFDDLYRTEGKAELIQGRIVRLPAGGYLPSKVAYRIFRSLDDYAVATGQGEAFAGGIGYAIPELPSRRESFSPDASYYRGALPANLMRFIDGAPTLAVEVRSENDCGPAAEADMAEKRADYLAAGTLVVWEVDPLARTVAVYRALSPDQATVYQVSEVADAEPAVRGRRCGRYFRVERRRENIGYLALH